MAGLLDFLNSDDARLGIGLLAASGPQTDPTKTGIGYALQSAMADQDARQKQALANQLMTAQTTEAQQKAAAQAYDLQRMQNWQAFVNSTGTAANAGAAPSAPTSPGLLGGSLPSMGATSGLLNATPGITVPTSSADGSAAPTDATASGGAPAPAAPSGKFAFGLPGVPDATARAIAGSMKPDEYMQKYLAQAVPQTDIEKMAASLGYDKGSPQYNAIVSAAIAKQTHQDLEQVRANSVALDPNTHQPVFQNTQAPEGWRTVYSNGMPVGYTPLVNNQTAIASVNEAQTGGKAAATNTVAFDENNQPIYSTGARDLNRARGLPPDAPLFGGTAAPTTAPGAAPPQQKDAALLNIAMRESGMQNIPNQPKPGEAPSTAEGYFQITRDTWKDGAKLAGVNLNQYPNPMAAPFPVQHAVASALYDARGETPWASSAAQASKFPGAWAVGGKGAPAPAAPTVAPTAPAGPVAATTDNTAPAGGVVRPQLPAGAAKGQELAQGGLDTDWNALQQRNLTSNSEISRLQNVRMYAANAITGTEIQRRDYFNSVLAAMGQPAAKDAKTASDLLDKQIAQMVAQQRTGAGASGTDAFQTLAAAGDPSRGMSQDAITHAVDQLVADRRMTQAQTAYMSPAGMKRDPVAYAQRAQQFATVNDPRIWQYQAITDPQQKKAFAQSVASTDPDFGAKIQAAVNLGVIK